MLLNESTALVTSRLVLRPYRISNVPKYHEWMSSPIIQQETASEPLSLEEEIEMCHSWRVDDDKLTFIIHSRIEGSDPKDSNFFSLHAESRMIGDINLFLSELTEDEPQRAELEIMIAEPAFRRNGLALEALKAFILYSMESCNLDAQQFFAKIGRKNEKSIKLFEKLGFLTRGKEVDIFDEVEMVTNEEKFEWSEGIKFEILADSL